MKLRSISVCASAGAVLTVLVCGVNRGQAASPVPLQNAGQGVSAGPGFQQTAWEGEKAEKLRRAYWILARGDHDYAGHRDKAMHQIREAADILGVDVHGGTHEHDRMDEKQPLSNHQLHEAKHALEDIVDFTHGKEHEHVRHAIDEIDSALAIH